MSSKASAVHRQELGPVIALGALAPALEPLAEAHEVEAGRAGRAGRFAAMLKNIAKAAQDIVDIVDPIQENTPAALQEQQTAQLNAARLREQELKAAIAEAKKQEAAALIASNADIATKSPAPLVDQLARDMSNIGKDKASAQLTHKKTDLVQKTNDILAGPQQAPSDPLLEVAFGAAAGAVAVGAFTFSVASEAATTVADTAKAACSAALAAVREMKTTMSGGKESFLEAVNVQSLPVPQSTIKGWGVAA